MNVTGCLRHTFPTSQFGIRTKVEGGEGLENAHSSSLSFKVKQNQRVMGQNP